MCVISPNYEACVEVTLQDGGTTEEREPVNDFLIRVARATRTDLLPKSCAKVNA